MHSLFARACGVFALIALAPASMPARAAGAVIVESTDIGCANPEATCHNIAEHPKTLQSIKIHATGAGKIVVNVSGFAGCTSKDKTAVSENIILTGILDNNKDSPNFFGPGSKQVVFTLPAAPSSGPLLGSTITNGVDSTRVFDVTDAGTQTYYFRHQAVFVGQKTKCAIFGGNMTATFVPK